MQGHGSITDIEPVEAGNLSASPCLLRVQRLEKDGFLTSYDTRIDVSKLVETRTVLTAGALE